MKTIQVPNRDQVSAGSQVIFDQFQKRLGRVPNLYATMGYSENALKGFVDFDAAFSHGVFRPKEREAIALIVSEINGCAYCLAGHTLAAIKNGFTKEETLDLRRGKSNDDKVNAIVQLAKSITINKGHADEQSLDDFYAAGFDEAALMELIGLVTVRIFTNYVFAATAIPVDFPLAEPIN
ncbi:carboxymuconolactone decarboxylase family protein [Mucilaginibacter sp. HC2]|uniref:carboxymuconolactone decarboxylase family protein n=1 Tax=Mucilaginibacter inviolabilis TaxID=2714892 RepID=UPI00140A7EC0|nr:carboxymuconolactone decarboxylase family protein [Mucilaginibacter inviolabilis]NHA04233.1 carboxymuconolactone decarboxylase family protein [Mucilaginibacter inviolabilis]